MPKMTSLVNLIKICSIITQNYENRRNATEPKPSCAEWILMMKYDERCKLGPIKPVNSSHTCYYPHLATLVSITLCKIMMSKSGDITLSLTKTLANWHYPLSKNTKQVKACWVSGSNHQLQISFKCIQLRLVFSFKINLGNWRISLAQLITYHEIPSRSERCEIMTIKTSHHSWDQVTRDHIPTVYPCFRTIENVLTKRNNRPKNSTKDAAIIIDG